MKYLLPILLLTLMTLEAKAEPGIRDSYAVDLILKNGSKFHKEVKNVPYVDRGTIVVFPGESFSIGVELDKDNKGIQKIFYDKDKTSKLGIDVSFKQEEYEPGKKMMVLLVESRLPKDLTYEAIMTGTSGRSEETSVVPVMAGISSSETWPYPIVRIDLKNFKFEEAK